MLGNEKNRSNNRKDRGRKTSSQITFFEKESGPDDRDNRTEFEHCRHCGTSLKTLKCDACGQKVDASWSACAYCGSPLGEKEKQSAQL